MKQLDAVISSNPEKHRYQSRRQQMPQSDVKSPLKLFLAEQTDSLVIQVPFYETDRVLDFEILFEHILYLSPAVTLEDVRHSLSSQFELPCSLPPSNFLSEGSYYLVLRYSHVSFDFTTTRRIRIRDAITSKQHRREFKSVSDPTCFKCEYTIPTLSPPDDFRSGVLILGFGKSPTLQTLWRQLLSKSQGALRRFAPLFEPES
jgi:hypothetical protein